MQTLYPNFFLTQISLYPTFEKPGFANWRPLKENRILWHVYFLTRILTATSYLHKRIVSQMTYQQNKHTVKYITQLKCMSTIITIKPHDDGSITPVAAAHVQPMLPCLMRWQWQPDTSQKWRHVYYLLSFWLPVARNEVGEVYVQTRNKTQWSHFSRLQNVPWFVL